MARKNKGEEANRKSKKRKSKKAENANVLRVRRTEPKDGDHPFTQVSNRILNDEKLSWKATGLLCYLLGRPPRWEIRMPHLISVKEDGRDSLRSAFKELEDHGYVVRERYRRANGQWATRTTLNERPRGQEADRG